MTLTPEQIQELFRERTALERVRDFFVFYDTELAILVTAGAIIWLFYKLGRWVLVRYPDFFVREE